MLGTESGGTGRKLLLLPALSSISTRHEMRPLQEQLVRRYSTLCVDWPGFGDQARPRSVRTDGKSCRPHSQPGQVGKVDTSREAHPHTAVGRCGDGFRRRSRLRVQPRQFANVQLRAVTACGQSSPRRYTSRMRTNRGRLQSWGRVVDACRPLRLRPAASRAAAIQ